MVFYNITCVPHSLNSIPMKTADRNQGLYTTPGHNPTIIDKRVLDFKSTDKITKVIWRPDQRIHVWVG